jgi:hypothetical protein
VSVRRLPNAAGPERIDARICFYRIPGAAGAALMTLLESMSRDAQILDFTAGIGDADAPLRYFTLLEDPVVRAVSVHEHALRDDTHELHSVALQLGRFGAFLRDGRTRPMIANCQVRSIAAGDGAVDAAGSVQALLETASERIDQMCVVGLAGRLADSMTLLCETFGWSMDRPAGFDAGRDRAGIIASLAPEDASLLLRLNEEDLKLYELAESRFDRDLLRSRLAHPRDHALAGYTASPEDVLAKYDAQYRLHRRELQLRSRDEDVENLRHLIKSAEAYADSLQHAYEELQKKFAETGDENERRVGVLTHSQAEAENYARGLLTELSGLRAYLNAVTAARSTEHAEAVRQIDALSHAHAEAQTYARSLSEAFAKAQVYAQSLVQAQAEAAADLGLLRKIHAEALAEMERLREKSNADLQHLKALESHWAVRLLVAGKHLRRDRER